ncbi:MAG: quinone-dependent dihydroorotate dehydrogenase [Tatlockia sp.]|jgi:dihydroorotate dehydrogenase
MYALIRPFLFQLEAEKAHDLALSLLQKVPACCFKPVSGKAVDAMGLKFPHPIGLAAGLDKNGDHLDSLSQLGFSFIEVGTVTPRAQEGNARPRLFRIPKASAVINRMGFNNKGVDALVLNVKKAAYRGILGINIGKNKQTPLEKAGEDYLYCLGKVYAHASYVTVNISSPNTQDLRLLQNAQYLPALLRQLTEEQKRLADQFDRQVPLLIKFSPDENDETLKRMADTVVSLGISGIIATNTTCAKESVATLPYGKEEGGLSGKPLFRQSTHCLRVIKQVVGKDVTLIGTGGIDSLPAAREKLQAGADLLQVYSALVYKGPGLIKELAEGLAK